MLRMKNLLVVVFVLAALGASAGLIKALPANAVAATRVVTSRADSGTGTLRQRLSEAQPGDTIIFDPAVFSPSAPVIIYVLSPLPQLNRNGLILDASNAGVILDGSQAPGGTSGLIVNADNCIVRGLTIRAFLSTGIGLPAGAANNTLGGSRNSGSGPNGQGNRILSNNGSGIELRGAGVDGNTIQGNYLGTDGSWDLGNNYNGIAIYDGAAYNIIGSSNPAYRNVIGGNQHNGIWISGSGTDHNQVIGNYIGTRADGQAHVNNSYSGITIDNGAQFNRIGGTLPGEGNLLSGNADNGLYVSDVGTNYNQVLGNLIGSDPTGTAIVGQGHNGIVVINGASYNSIGNGTSAGRNLIGGNALDGIRIEGTATTSNTVQGNLISTNISGTAAVPNGLHGVELTGGAYDNRVGGNRLLGQGNLISGDLNHGVIIYDGAHDNVVAGNFIGPDVTGMYSLGNHPMGAIDIANGAHDNTIGGWLPGEGNLISGNHTDGIALFNSGGGNVVHNWVVGNTIGLALDGVTPLPNENYGIFNVSGALSSQILSNTVAYHHYGIWVTECSGNTLSQNSIFSNTQQGIKIERPCLVSPPLLTATTSITITGLTTPTARVEFFSDDVDEGRWYEGYTVANASGYFTFARPANAIGPNVTATSTDAAGNTSAFAPPVRLLWTLLLYFNGDNDLEEALDETLTSLTAAPGARANVLVLMDRYTNTVDSQARLYNISTGSLNSIATTLGTTLTVPGELNMGSGQTLADFVTWGRAHYPARYSMLAIVDHGGGWAPGVGPDAPGALKHHDHWLAGNSGLSWDFSEGFDYLDSPELRQTFAAMTDNGVKPVDVVFYDVCLMGMVEVAYQIREYASFFVSSQNIGWAPVGESNRYVRLMQSIGSATTPQQLAEATVNAYADATPPYEHPFTISALDLRQLPTVTLALDQLGQVLSQTLVDAGRADLLHTVYSETQKIDYDGDFEIEPATDGFVDAYDLAVRAAQYYTASSVLSAARAVTTALASAIVAEQHRSGAPWMALDRTWNLDRVHGLSIFLPLGEDLELQIPITETSPITPGLIVTRNLRLRETYTSGQLEFVAYTSWQALIDAYYVAAATPVPTNTTGGPVNGLQTPDVLPPASTLLLSVGEVRVGQPVTLTWTSVDTQTGVISATLWQQLPNAAWLPLQTQPGASGEFVVPLPLACNVRLAVRAVDVAGNVEPAGRALNTVSLAIDHCLRLPVLSRS